MAYGLRACSCHPLMCFGLWSYTVFCTDAAMDVMQCYWLNIIVTFVIFVTHDRNDTIMGIRKLLQNTPQWLHHIKNILSALDNTTQSAASQHTMTPIPLQFECNSYLTAALALFTCWWATPIATLHNLVKQHVSNTDSNNTTLVMVRTLRTTPNFALGCALC